MILAVLMEHRRIYCLAKTLDLVVVKLTRRETETDATTDLFDLLILRKSFFFCTFKFDFNSHNLSCHVFPENVPYFPCDVFHNDCWQTPSVVQSHVIASNS
jgi:hypothetical protein